jgi:hypothetical protein
MFMFVCYLCINVTVVIWLSGLACDYCRIYIHAISLVFYDNILSVF